MARPQFAPRKPGQPSIGRRRTAVAAITVVSKIPDGITSNDELAELMGSLTGKDVKVGSAPVLQSGPASPVVVSVYLDEHGTPGALFVADIAASAGISAALTLMSVGSVTEAIRDGALDEILLENWNEVANICTQIVRVPNMPVYKLDKSIQTSTGLTPAVEALLLTAPYRIGWSIQVPGFANGKLSVFLAEPDED